MSISFSDDLAQKIFAKAIDGTNGLNYKEMGEILPSEEAKDLRHLFVESLNDFKLLDDEKNNWVTKFGIPESFINSIFGNGNKLLIERAKWLARNVDNRDSYSEDQRIDMLVRLNTMSSEISSLDVSKTISNKGMRLINHEYDPITLSQAITLVANLKKTDPSVFIPKLIKFINHRHEWVITTAVWAIGEYAEITKAQDIREAVLPLILLGTKPAHNDNYLLACEKIRLDQPYPHTLKDKIVETLYKIGAENVISELLKIKSHDVLNHQLSKLFLKSIFMLFGSEAKALLTNAKGSSDETIKDNAVFFLSIIN